MEGRKFIVRKDLLYPELSYDINNVLFDVFRQLGFGHPEKYYQKAVATGLQTKGIKFIEQFYVPLKFNGQIVGKYFLDFLIEDVVILELKKDYLFNYTTINQSKQYLYALNLQLALIAYFTKQGVVTKRVINLPPVS